jgi:N-acetylglucosamine-6-phosphate deacetylase
MFLTNRTIADNVNPSSAAVELDFAVHERKNGEIITDSYPATGMKSRTDLPNKNISCPNGFAPKSFNSPSLSIGISTVSA